MQEGDLMANEMRDRLVELLVKDDIFDERECGMCTRDNYCVRCGSEMLADHLIANGVIVPPCKVGDTVYYIEGAYYNSQRLTARPIKVTEISWKCDRSGRDLGFALIANGTRYKFSSIGKTVFLTKEQAEQKLKEMRGADNG